MPQTSNIHVIYLTEIVGCYQVWCPYRQVNITWMMSINNPESLVSAAVWLCRRKTLMLLGKVCRSIGYHTRSRKTRYASVCSKPTCTYVYVITYTYTSLLDDEIRLIADYTKLWLPYPQNFVKIVAGLWAVNVVLINWWCLDRFREEVTVFSVLFISSSIRIQV